MREPLAIFYFMLPVLIPAVIAAVYCGWASVMVVRDQLNRVKEIR